MTADRQLPVIDMIGTGRRIERCRKAAGLSVRDVQAYFGFEYPQAIYKWQHGESLPTVDNLLALSTLLQVSMEDLLVCEDRKVSLFPGAFPNKNCPRPRRKQFGQAGRARVFRPRSSCSARFQAP